MPSLYSPTPYPTRLLVSGLGLYWGWPQCMWIGKVFDITQRHLRD